MPQCLVYFLLVQITFCSPLLSFTHHHVLDLLILLLDFFCAISSLHSVFFLVKLTPFCRCEGVLDISFGTEPSSVINSF